MPERSARKADPARAPLTEPPVRRPSEEVPTPLPAGTPWPTDDPADAPAARKPRGFDRYVDPKVYDPAANIEELPVGARGPLPGFRTLEDSYGEEADRAVHGEPYVLWFEGKIVVPRDTPADALDRNDVAPPDPSPTVLLAISEFRTAVAFMAKKLGSTPGQARVALARAEAAEKMVRASMSYVPPTSTARSHIDYLANQLVGCGFTARRSYGVPSDARPFQEVEPLFRRERRSTKNIPIEDVRAVITFNPGILQDDLAEMLYRGTMASGKWTEADRKSARDRLSIALFRLRSDASDPFCAVTRYDPDGRKRLFAPGVASRLPTARGARVIAPLPEAFPAEPPVEHVWDAAKMLGDLLRRLPEGCEDDLLREEARRLLVRQHALAADYRRSGAVYDPPRRMPIGVACEDDTVETDEEFAARMRAYRRAADERVMAHRAELERRAKLAPDSTPEPRSP